MGLSDISAPDVRKAIDEFRELGRAGFLDQYGYEDAARWELVVDGERFPSKAILGVAHKFARPDLGPLRELSGGPQTTTALRRLGFEVEDLHEEGSAGNATPSAWIFQANLARYDLPGALEELSVVDWEVNQSRRQIHVGDTVYLWQAGSNAGVLARAEVLTEPDPIPASVRKDPFSLQPGAEDDKPRVWLRILRVLDQPLLKTELLQDEVTADLSIIRFANATNFGLTDAQATALADQFDARTGREVEREKLFFFTASSKLAAHHMQISLIDGIPLETVSSIVDLAGRFNRHARAGRVFAWGARPGSAAEQKWDRLNAGDIGLVYADGEFAYWGRVYAKARSEEVARRVWGEDESGQIWECMFFLDPVERFGVPREELVTALGYQANYIPQGFEIPGAEAQSRVLNHHPVLMGFLDSVRKAKPDIEAISRKFLRV